MKIAVVRIPWFGQAAVGAALVVALLITNVAWVAPRESERVRLEATETALRAEIADLQTGIQEMAGWRLTHPEADGLRGVAKEARPAGIMVPTLLEALGAIGTRRGVRSELIQPAGAPTDESVSDPGGALTAYRKVDLHLRLEGEYRNLGEYLRDVEGLDQMVLVRSVNVRYEASTDPRLIADLSLWVYGKP